MKPCIVIITMAALLFLVSTAGISQENSFYDNSDDIVKALSTSPPVKTRGLTRSFTQGKPTKKRTIMVLAKENDKPVATAVEIEENVAAPQVNMRVEFDTNSSTIRRECYGLLDELGKAVTHPDLKDKVIRIIGHTDSDGTEPYNLSLSLERADSVRSYISNRFSINPDRLNILGYGELVPLVPNNSPYNKQKNRRVEIQAR